jgi:hypothetical protein
VKVRQRVDDRGRPVAPFERSVAEWQALDAPADLYDVQLAAAAELAEHGAILEPDSPSWPGPLGVYAGRHWRRMRPAFLAAKGALTAVEAALLAERSRAREQPKRGGSPW